MALPYYREGRGGQKTTESRSKSDPKTERRFLGFGDAARGAFLGPRGLLGALGPSPGPPEGLLRGPFGRPFWPRGAPGGLCPKLRGALGAPGGPGRLPGAILGAPGPPGE